MLFLDENRRYVLFRCEKNVFNEVTGLSMFTSIYKKKTIFFKHLVLDALFESIKSQFQQKATLIFLEFLLNLAFYEEDIL